MSILFLYLKNEQAKLLYFLFGEGGHTDLRHTPVKLKNPMASGKKYLINDGPLTMGSFLAVQVDLNLLVLHFSPKIQLDFED